MLGKDANSPTSSLIVASSFEQNLKCNSINVYPISELGSSSYTRADTFKEQYTELD
jgi:hypothetical protein